MGANPKQALGLLLFIIGFVLIAAACYAGANAILLIIGLVLLGAAVAVFLKAKPLEHLEG